MEFYKFSTRILEEYQALEDKSKPEEEVIFISLFIMYSLKNYPKKIRKKKKSMSESH